MTEQTSRQFIMINIFIDKLHDMIPHLSDMATNNKYTHSLINQYKHRFYLLSLEVQLLISKDER